MPEWLNKFARFGQGASPFLTFLTGLGSGLFNFFSQRGSNDTNLQISRETNAANAEQAELAYHRSLPITQVSNLMSAGMSKQGALSALTGGGQYNAPVMQGASVSPAQFDPTGLYAAFDRLGSLSSNVEQQRILEAQRHDLEVTTANKINAEKRAQEVHEYENWQRMYGKESAQKLDAAQNLIMNALLDSGKEFRDFNSYEDLVRGLGLQGRSELRSLPSIARQNLYSSVRDGFAEQRAQREQRNRDIAAQDAHNIARLREQIERINVKYYDKEKHEQLLNLMRVGEGLIQENNIKFQDYTAKEMENFVRSAGLEDEAQARALAEYVKRLSNEDEIDIQFKRKTANDETFGLWNNGRMLLRDLGEILARVNLGK